jgi:hypothetical protein
MMGSLRVSCWVEIFFNNAHNLISYEHAQTHPFRCPGAAGLLDDVRNGILPSSQVNDAALRSVRLATAALCTVSQLAGIRVRQ